MEKKYVIMAHIVEKDYKNRSLNHVEGYYTYSYTPEIWIPGSEIKWERIYVAHNLNAAEKFLQHLRKAYKNEFQRRAKDCKISKNEFKFWIKKLDSSTTPIKIKGPGVASSAIGNTQDLYLYHFEYKK